MTAKCHALRRENLENAHKSRPHEHGATNAERIYEKIEQALVQKVCSM